MPTISIIIPAYNAENTILKTIESVQQQSFSDFELIIINDGSTDRTLELLHKVTDDRLKIFSYANAGVSVARNRGIDHARGEFIAFLDTDDLWTQDKLLLQLAALRKHPEAGVAYSWTHFLDQQGESIYAGNPVCFQGDVYTKLLVWNFLYSGSNPLIRRQALEHIQFDPTLTHGEDWELYLRLAARWHFVVVPKAQILYRQTSGSASSKIEVMEKGVLTVIAKVFSTVPSELQYLKNQSLAHLYQFLSHLYIKRTPSLGEANQASQNLQKAIRLYPRILLYKKTQILLLKLLLIRGISPRKASYLLQLISKVRATRTQSYSI